MSTLRRTLLFSLGVLLFSSAPIEAAFAQQVLLGDPVDPNGRALPMMPGVPLLLPGEDQEFGTGDDIIDPNRVGDVDLVVRVGTIIDSSVPPPFGAPGGPGLVVGVAGGGNTGQGDEIPFTVIVTDGTGDPPYGNALMLGDMDWRPVAVFASADLDSDGVIGPTNADGAADNAIELQEASAFVGRQVGSLWLGRTWGSLGIQIAAPASIGGLTVVLSAGAYTGTDPNQFFGDGPPILTLWPYFPPLRTSLVIGGANYGPPDPRMRTEVMFGVDTNYLTEPDHPVLGTPFAVPVDGSSPTTDQFIVISGPATSARFADELSSATFVPTSRVWMRPAPTADGLYRTLVLPLEHLDLPADGNASELSLRLLPTDLFGNVADPDSGGFAVDLVTKGHVRIVSPDVDGDPTSESLVLASAAGAEIVLDDAGAGLARIDLLQGSRALGSLPITVSVGPDSDGDGLQDGYDNCLLVFNPTQADADQNGLGNCCDGYCVNNPGSEGCLDCGGWRRGAGGGAVVPTLPEWGLYAMMLSLIAAASLVLRQRALHR